MTPVAAPTLRPPRHARATQTDAPAQPRQAQEPCRIAQTATYDRQFWLAYLSNLLLAAATSLLFRYADFVTLLGGTEFHLGWIVGVGMVGSLAMRLVLGSWIDRYGAGPLWLGSLLLFGVTCFAHLTVASHTGATIYLLRICYCCAVAGVGGASMTFVSMRTTNGRLAEMVGMLGTGGFVGVVAGTLLGDLLFGSITITSAQVAEMFIGAGLIALLGLPFAWAATRGERASRSVSTAPLPMAASTHSSALVSHPSSLSPHTNRLPKGTATVSGEPSLPTLLWRYNPGIILIISATMGMALGLPNTFLRTYATEQGIPRIGFFFLVYCIAAVAIRVPTRRWTERFGPRRIILAGMAGMTASIAIFPLVHREWQLTLPAIGFGCSHAILWPAVVAAGSVTFPPRNRGLATILLLAAWDCGLVIASPAVGAILKYGEAFGLPPYPTMFFSMAGLLALVTIWYAVTRSDAVRQAASKLTREQKAA